MFLLPFVLARVFRPTLLDVFQITNTELGLWFSVYGIVAMISYLFGGVLADRLPARKLMSMALWLTSGGGLMMALVPSNRAMLLLYAGRALQVSGKIRYSHIRSDPWYQKITVNA